MSLSLNLVIALVLLAPGLGAYVAVFGDRRRIVRFSAPPPTSIASLGVVTLGAVLVHALWGICLIVNDQVARAHPLIRTPWNPNAYETALAIGGHMSNATLHAGDLVYLLLSSLWLFALGVALFNLLLLLDKRAHIFSPLLYGWAEDLLQAGETEVVTAFVLTDLQIDSAALGYEGIVETLALDGQRDISSILLSECTRFHIAMQRGQIHTVVDRRGTNIPQLHISGAHIRNIAFNIYQLGV